MHFNLSNHIHLIDQTKTGQAFLMFHEWDDWFAYSTSFTLVYLGLDDEKHTIGTVKIGQMGMGYGRRRSELDDPNLAGIRTPNVPMDFPRLPNSFFSVGQDVSYYNNLNRLGADIRDEILSGLNDMALSLNIYADAIAEKVTRTSLLRSITPTSVRGQFRRLAQGIAELSEYEFQYVSPSKGFTSITIDVRVIPESNPPSNIHVLIGRNGVGKTQLLNNMIDSLLNPRESKYGKFTSNSEIDDHIFANIVFISFSAFDVSEPTREVRDKTQSIHYSYIGLKKVQKNDGKKLAPKSPTILKNEFVKSIEVCRRGAKNERWKRALKILESDPIFDEAQLARVAEIENDEEFKTVSAKLFHKLSTGHKIVLLSITRLVETIEERTLILLDEPESHLHPPLISAYIRSLSDLLIQQNGVAIIATHSPVVLQEVPKSCVYTLRRSGAQATVERLDNESFGENVGTLTREVFGLEVTYSGFHKMLINAVKSRPQQENALDYQQEYERVSNLFNNELGSEARAIVRTLIYSNEEN